MTASAAPQPTAVPQAAPAVAANAATPTAANVGAPASATSVAASLPASVAAAGAATPGPHVRAGTVNASTPPATAADITPAGSVVISAIGLADPSDPRYANDQTLLQTDARADSKQQLVEKALVLLLDRKSFAANYDVLQSRVVAKSGDFIDAVVREGEPQIGKDGLMSITTQAVVNVKAVQQSLNRLSRDERVELIRASGDPRVSVRVVVRDADDPNAPPLPSPIAENVLKERIKSFGFRTWSDDPPGGERSADFAVTSEAVVKRLSTRLAASGLVITKYALSAWTVKGTNRVSGEEIYFNTTLPKGLGTFASEEEALRAIGTRVADQFSRELFLQHVNVTGRKVTLVVSGMPDAASEELFARELIGLPAVIAAHPGPPGAPRLYDLEVAAADGGSAAVARDVLAPLNAKLGHPCFGVGAVDGARVAVTFDALCADGLRARLETNPPAGLYGAPPARQKAIIKNPETLRKLA
jgi:eukaryotic-like serine/threonine-protein kinase